MSIAIETHQRPVKLLREDGTCWGHVDYITPEPFGRQVVRAGLTLEQTAYVDAVLDTMDGATWDDALIRIMEDDA